MSLTLDHLASSILYRNFFLLTEQQVNVYRYLIEARDQMDMMTVTELRQAMAPWPPLDNPFAMNYRQGVMDALAEELFNDLPDFPLPSLKWPT